MHDRQLEGFLVDEDGGLALAVREVAQDGSEVQLQRALLGVFGLGLEGVDVRVDEVH